MAAFNERGDGHKVRHLSRAGEHREKLAIKRWLVGHARQVVGAMGLTEGWWCGINLPRAQVFDDGVDGDVDLIAGPVHYDFTNEELRRRIQAEGDRSPFAEMMAHYRAAAIEQRIIWPPEVNYVVACEVKASYFTASGWKARHRNGGRRLGGQLKYLQEKGVNAISFLHIAATDPDATRDIHEAVALLEQATKTFPEILAPQDWPEFGRLRGVMAALPTELEHMSGVHQTEVVRRPMVRGLASQGWHARLGERLSRLEKPRCRSVFILSCSACREWRVVNTTWQVPSCSCGFNDFAEL